MKGENWVYSYLFLFLAGQKCYVDGVDLEGVGVSLVLKFHLVFALVIGMIYN
jgi:hypothetical protein